MKRTFISTLVMIALLVTSIMIASCTQEQKDPYMEYPLTGKTYQEPSRNYSILAGTYYLGDYAGSLVPYSEYYWVSFHNNGTLTMSPAYYSLYALDKAMTDGTWAIDGSSMTVSVGGKSFTGTKTDVPDAGFGVVKNSYDKLAFAKMSDSQLSVVTSSSLEGLWFKTNDYGKNFGYRFLSDGTCYIYQSDGTTIKSSWALSTKGTKLRIENAISDYNVAIVDGYLLLNSAGYQKTK
jgi:hypothetical protein